MQNSRYATIAAILAVTAACYGGGDAGQSPDPDPAAITVAAGSRQLGVVGEVLPGPLVVRVLDDAGRPIPGKVVHFRLPDGEDGALDPVDATTDASGQATTLATLGTTVGPWVAVAEVEAADGSVLEAVIRATGVAAPPDSVFTYGGIGQSAPVGDILADSLSVRVVDRFGNPISNATVTWETREGGSLDFAETRTGSSGIASVERRLGLAAGVQHTLASVGSIGGSPVIFEHTALAGPPAALLYVSGDGQSADTGAALPDPLSVKVKDAAGNPLEGVLVTWTVETGGGSVDHNESSTGPDGSATTSWTMGDLPGRQTLTVSVPGLLSLIFQATALSDEASETSRAP